MFQNMLLKERINAFAKLGDRVSTLSGEEFEELSRRIKNNNSWFTQENVKEAFSGLQLFLKKESLEDWISPYKLNPDMEPKTIGLMLAGNIPAVGFHDLLCVLITGHRAAVKLSSTDSESIKWLVSTLMEIEPQFEELVTFEEMLKNKDAYIATGSDNSSRYFDYYFGKYPHIIRKNRTSVAVLNGEEKPEDFLSLGKDIFQYFGLGCRNVSKVYIPNRDILKDLLDAVEEFNSLADHHKYRNNYDYNKSIYLVNGEDHLDNGFLLLKENEELVSPISVLYFEVYSDQNSLEKKMKEKSTKIQCIVSNKAWYPGSFDFGQAQCPSLSDYSDGIDTISFLKDL